MLGLGDFWIVSAYLLCIASALACVIYGLINWNKGGDNESREVEEEKKWEKEEIEIEDKL